MWVQNFVARYHRGVQVGLDRFKYILMVGKEVIIKFWRANGEVVNTDSDKEDDKNEDGEQAELSEKERNPFGLSAEELAQEPTENWGDLNLNLIV